MEEKRSIVLRTEYKMSPEKRKYLREYKRKYRKDGREKKEWLKAYQKDYHKRYYDELRKRVFNYYGEKCSCCGESEVKFLAIDHINGGGRKHRKLIKKNTYLWLIKNNFPNGFQVLCHNCNMAKGFYGECPHKSLKYLNK